MASNVNGFLPQSVGNTDTTAEVNLLPCLHRVKKVFAESHYGPMVKGVYNLTGKVCDVCKKPVVGWNQVDTVIRVDAQNPRGDFVGLRFTREPLDDLGSQPSYLGASHSMESLLKKMHDDFHSE